MSRNILFSWTAPTQRQDNTSLPLAQISKIKLLVEGATPGQFSVVADNISASATSYTLNAVAPGTYKYGLVYVDTDNHDGSMAVVDNVVVPVDGGGGGSSSPPKAASGFTAQVQPA